MVIGAIIVFGSVVLMNRYVERKEAVDTKTVKMDVQKAKKKKKPPVKKKVQKKKQKPKRSAPPPPAGLDSVIGGSGIGLGFDLTKEKMNKCLNNSQTQDEILNERIEAQKNYEIDSTPTVYVNGKKYSGKVNYKSFKKIIEKNL